jgi:hypothetical protein
VRSWRTRLAKDAGTSAGSRIHQGSVYQMRNGNEDEIHFARRTAALAQGNAAPA